MTLYTPDDIKAFIKPYKVSYVSTCTGLTRMCIYNLIRGPGNPSYKVVEKLSKFVNDHKAS
jgi:hypothetical protein